MSFLTVAGEQQLANKQGNSQLVNIEKFVLAYVPSLADEPEDRVESVPDDAFIVDTRAYTKRSYVNGNQVVYSLVMDSSVGDFTFNWIGLVDDENVLIAVAHITAIDKTKSSEGVRGNTIARNFLLKYTGIQNLTATTVPAETWQLDFSTRMAGIDERERLSNFDIFGHESFLDDAWLVSGANGAYQIATGVGYVGGIRVENQDDTLTKTFDYPNQLWLNVSLQGDVSDRSAVVEFIMDSGDFKDYEDDNGITHYLTKLADIADDGSVIDARTIYENVAQHEAKADPHPQYKAYTDEQISEALGISDEDATTKTDTALASAKTYTDSETAATLANAKTYTDSETASTLASAKTYADSAKASAISTASSDATTKANAALAGAKTYTDNESASTLASAKTYADSAKASAISTASSDATTKANAALASANVYSSNAGNLTSGTVPDARLPSDLARTSVDGQEFGDQTVFSGAQVFFGGGEHSLFNNDGLGNAGMKLGCNKSVMTVDGGAFELEAYVDQDSEMGWHIGMSVGGQAVGDTVDWSDYKLKGKSDGSLTWGGKDVLTTGDLSLTGSIHFFATQAAPDGFVKANGATLQIDSYPELYSKIGTTFGGDGVNTFAVPDLRGEFVRGYDDGRGVDSGRGFGSWQEDAIRNITGTITGVDSANATGVFAIDGTESDDFSAPGGSTNPHVIFDASNVVPTASDNRPRNVALIAYIKY